MITKTAPGHYQVDPGRKKQQITEKTQKSCQVAIKSLPKGYAVCVNTKGISPFTVWLVAFSVSLHSQVQVLLSWGYAISLCSVMACVSTDLWTGQHCSPSFKAITPCSRSLKEMLSCVKHLSEVRDSSLICIQSLILILLHKVQSTHDRHILHSGPRLPSPRAPSRFKTDQHGVSMAETQPGAFTIIRYAVSNAHGETEQ